MPGGLLNRDIIDYWTKTPMSAADLRNKLLNRNLPEPVPSELRGTQFENYFDSIGQVKSFPNPLIGESIPFDEDLSLENQATDQRLFILPLNTYYGGTEGRDYQQFNVVRPGSFYPTLEAQYSNYMVSGLEPHQRGKYVTSSNIDRFKLLGDGDVVGRRNPYAVMESSDVSSLNESFLGIVAKEQLNSSILRTQGLLTEIQNKNVPNKYMDGLVDGSTNIKSYRLTEPLSAKDLTTEYIQLLQGVTNVYSTLPNEAVGWNEYSRVNTPDNVLDILGNIGVNSETALSTEGRSVEMLLRTSDGQKLILYSNFNQNKYVPNYQDPRIVELLGDNMPNSRYYIGDDKSTNRGDTLTKTFKPNQFNDGEETIKSTSINDDGTFQWKMNGEDFNPKTLLGKTQQMVNSNSDRIFINQTDKFFKDTVKDKYVSRGSAIRKNDEDATSFFRVWTKDDQYSYKNAISKTGLRFKPEDIGATKTHLSVLQENGMVKTHPTMLDKNAELKKYMLSIENLAWSDNVAELPKCEVGNGDPISGNKGRLMWFAPYDLQFDENVNANWTSTEFIGRGEPVYTYNNTKRSGQLRFKIVVDHPSVINEYRGRQSNLLEKFFSGGKTFEEVLQDFIGLNVIDLNTEKLIENKLNSIKSQVLSKTGDNLRLSIFFDSNSSTVSNATVIPKNNDFFNNMITLTSLLENSKELSITLKGHRGFIGRQYSSEEKLEKKEGTKELSNKRIESVKVYLKGLGIKVGGDRSVEDNDFIEKNKSSNGAKGPEQNAPSLDEAQIEDRRVDILVSFDNSKLNDIRKEKIKEDLQFNIERIPNIAPDECNYFDIIDESFPTYFKTISEKIKYFHPGFHSTTPESLNSRITFLQQCMRQGPSINSTNANIKPQNLSFGKPPVCILRIGDFFHSKVIINSLSFNYAGGGTSPQWDLNPEGIGVQPMTVDVNLSVDIVGGQSLIGPINRLQNALSFNFYANTEMYDKRSDTIKVKGSEYELQNAEYPPDGYRSDVANQQLSDSDDKKTTAESNEIDESKNTNDTRTFTPAELAAAAEVTRVFGN